MSLSDRLNEDMKQAMKSKDKFRLSNIRLIRSTIKNLEIDLKRFCHVRVTNEPIDGVTKL